jgi:cytoskeleton protein RodZ
MSETSSFNAPEAPDAGHVSAVSAGGVLTAGQLLKAARLRSGVDLLVLSLSLKVPVGKLEALEADHHPADESPVFVRSLAAAVSRRLGVDPAPILALLPQAANYIEPHGAVRHSLITPTAFAQTQRPAAKFRSATRWSAVGMALLIAALIWLPNPSQWTWLHAISASLGTVGSSERTVTAEPQAVLPVPAASEALPLGAVVVVPSQTDASAPATAAPAPAPVQVPVPASVGTPSRPAAASDVTGSGARFEVKP